MMPDLVRVIKYRGIFDIQGLMRAMQQWIVNQGYEFHEVSVKYKVPTPLGAEPEFGWWAWRKVNEYIKFHIDVYFHYWEVKDVEVIRNGKKEKSTRAAVQIEIRGRTELDWQNRFGGSRFSQALGDFYNRYIIRKDLDLYWTDQLYYRLYKLHKVAKDYLEFETKANAFEHVW